MILSSKGEYALRMLAFMAEHPANGFTTLRDISNGLELSEKYMETIAKNLVRGGILSAVRGKGGGYQFRRMPEQITLWEVLCLTEGELKVSKTLRNAPVVNWQLQAIMQGLDRSICEYLTRYTIYDLVQREQSGDDYVI